LARAGIASHFSDSSGFAPSVSHESRRGAAVLDFLSRHSRFGGPSQLLRERRQQLLYLVVGAWNTAFGYGEWALLQHLLQGRLHYLAILVLAWPLAVLNAYVCYRRFVLRSSGSVRKELPRFALVYFGTLIGGLAALPFLLHALPFDIYVVQAAYTAIVVVLSYIAHKVFSFGGLQSPGGAVHKGD